MPSLLNSQFPTQEADYRIAVICDSVQPEDLQVGRHFSHTAARFLSIGFSSARLLHNAVFFGALYNYVKPWDKNWRKADETPLARTSKAQLKLDLDAFKPNIIVLLGEEALWNAGIQHSLDNYRGSLFVCRDSDSPFFNYKCIASYDPSDMMKAPERVPLLSFDLSRAKEEANSPELILPSRTYETELALGQVVSRLEAIEPGTLTSIDIEGGIPNPEHTNPELRFPNGITCIGVSTDPSSAFIVNPLAFDNAGKVEIFKALARVLGDPTIPKVLQNSLYDNFVLSWEWKMPIRNVVWDTMLAFWELYPELPKSLACQVSLLTKTPYYKWQRTTGDLRTKLEYCCTDAAVTLECALKQMKLLQRKPLALAHQQFNTSLLSPILYMELKGINYDKEKAQLKLAETLKLQADLQEKINLVTGGLNVNSPKQMKAMLYDKLEFEPQYKKEGGRRTKELTTDAEALLNIYKKTSSPLIFNILKWRQYDADRKQLSIDTDSDGRVRSSYNIVGTDTCRLNNSESPTGSGMNLQTVKEIHRDIYCADPGYELFQCDLAGADGWTVAAHSKALGDPMMWDDLSFGLKPALIIAAMYLHGASVNLMSREDLLPLTEEIKKSAPGWLYPACKATQHGSCYGMGENTTSTNILRQSWKKTGSPIFVPPKDCKKLQTLFLEHRYIGVAKWQKWVAQQLEQNGYLINASGHIRQFLGDRKHHETIKTAYSQEPQHNTTYATNLALYKLWNDPENRTPQNRPIIQPVHQVHDALIGQWPIELRDWARAKVKSYFNNTLTIAGIDVVIPYDGKYGRSWGELTNKI